ncbi:MAG: type VI secretion system tip protein VgrG, partial [Thermodesulfobacteriota bacterium]
KQGRGEAYYYGDHIRTPEEGERLAKIRAESLLCRREVFQGEGAVPYIAPGFTFDLKEHYRSTFNQGYLVTEVSHEGNQEGYLVSGLSLDDQTEKEVFYGNTFTAIPANVQYRPERLTPRPRICGAITAKIDAAGSGQYAELDEHGRYKVVVPFDTSGRKDGKASTWIRMATPYAGSDHGMHFPLHKGTEVLLTFEEGDPDRPVIASAVPNPENPSPVNSANQTKSVITTASGNKIHMEDQAGSERILMHSPNQESFIRIGAHNDPGGRTKRGDFGIAEKTGGALEIQARGREELFGGEVSDWVLGGRIWFTLFYAMDLVLGGKLHLRWPECLSFVNRHQEVATDEFRTTIDDIVTDEIDTTIRAIRQRVRGEITTAVGNRLNTTSAKVRVVAERLQTVVQRNMSAESSLGVDGNLLETMGGMMDNTLSAIKTAGVEMETAGQKIQNVGSDLLESDGSLIKSSGVSVKSVGGSLVEAAGLLLEN